MKTHIRNTLALITILTTAAFGQGGLTPPSAPTPTMRSLLEIFNEIVNIGVQASDLQTDTFSLLAQGTAAQAAIAALKDNPRTPITTIPFTITQPGSYYLTRNFTVTSGTAITITSANVTLDLSGFTLSSTAAGGSGDGILIAGGVRNIQISNGHITGTTTVAAGVFTPGGFNNGIISSSSTARNITATGIHVAGVASNGVFLNAAASGTAIIERCSATICTNIGLLASIVRHSTATDTGDSAIQGIVVSDSIGVAASETGGGSGIIASEVSNSRGVGTDEVGISGSNIINSRGTSISGAGINADIVTNCSGISTSGIGISAVRNVTNSFGTSVTGTAGIFVSGTASFCRAEKSSGIAISAGIAIGCSVLGGGTISAPEKHLGTP